MSNIYRRSGANKAPCSDPMPLFIDGVYHVIHLSPPWDSLGTVVPEIRSKDTQRHISSTDLVHWKVHEPALYPGEPGEVDEDGCWTGSLVRKRDDGAFYLYYCAFDHDAENPQKICLATSEDGEHFVKRPEFPILRPAEYLEQIDYRDSYVFWNEDEGIYWMVLAARYESGGPFHRKGVITYRTSEDLWNWSEDHVLYAPWYMVCPECPEMFKMGDWWYLCYSHFDQNAKTTYRISKSCHGPWRVPSLPGFDGRRFYAARTLTDGNRRFQWGNIYEREGLNNESRWTYAGDMAMVHELIQREDGSLTVKVPQEIVDSFDRDVEHEFVTMMGEFKADGNNMTVDATSGFAYGFFKEESEDALMLSAKVTLKDGNGAFGILLKSTEDLSPSWELIFEPARSRVSITRYPVALDPFWEGLNPKIKDAPVEVDGPRTIERPLHIEKGKEIDLKCFVDDSFVECFVNEEVALSFRIYDPTDGAPIYKFGLFSEDDTVEIRDIHLREESDL